MSVGVACVIIREGTKLIYQYCVAARACANNILFGYAESIQTKRQESKHIHTTKLNNT